MHAGEIFGHHRAGQAHGLKVQTAAIGRQHRNPHLRHDLQQTRINRLAIAAHGFGQSAFDQPATHPVRDGILRQIGVHRGRPTADQHRKIMRINAFRRPHVDRTEGAQALARQPECTAEVARIIGIATMSADWC